MSRRAAILTQAEIARALRAAKQVGASGVEVKPDGTVVIRLSAVTREGPADEQEQLNATASLENTRGAVLY